MTTMTATAEAVRPAETTNGMNGVEPAPPNRPGVAPRETLRCGRVQSKHFYRMITESRMRDERPGELRHRRDDFVPGPQPSYLFPAAFESRSLSI